MDWLACILRTLHTQHVNSACKLSTTFFWAARTYVDQVANMTIAKVEETICILDEVYIHFCWFWFINFLGSCIAHIMRTPLCLCFLTLHSCLCLSAFSKKFWLFPPLFVLGHWYCFNWMCGPHSFVSPDHKTNTGKLTLCQLRIHSSKVWESSQLP